MQVQVRNTVLVKVERRRKLTGIGLIVSGTLQGQGRLQRCQSAVAPGAVTDSRQPETHTKVRGHYTSTRTQILSPFVAILALFRFWSDAWLGLFFKPRVCLPNYMPDWSACQPRSNPLQISGLRHQR